MPKQSKKTNNLSREAFAALTTDQRVSALRGKYEERLFYFDRESADEEKRTVWLSISSDTEEVERWWGVEILDHRPESIRTDRLRAGFPILVGHDHDDHVGVAESYEITRDGKLRVQARFGNSARSEEVWRDVLDGIRVNTSVGYLIHDLVLERQTDGVDYYRVNDWQPYEGSIVSVPADISVGVGRGLDQLNEGRKEMTDNNKEDKTAPATPAAPAAPEPVDTRALSDEAQRTENKRVMDLLAAGDSYENFGGKEIARELIKDPKANIDTFRARVLDAMGSQKPTPTADPVQGPTNGTEPRSGDGLKWGEGGRQMILRGRQLRAFTKPIMFSDGSKMEAEESAYRSAQWLMATVYNQPKARQWCNERGIDTEQRIMQTGVNTLGGFLVPTEMEQAIIDLRESYGLARRLARRRPMGSDTKSIPRRTGGVTAYFIDEDNAGVTASDKGWDNVNLVAKTLAALSMISKNLEEDAVIDVIDDLAMEQAYAFAKKEDECWLIGDGTSTYGGMQGLLTKFNATAYASRYNAATDNDTFAEFDNPDLAGVRGAMGDLPMINNPVWLSSKTFAENVFTRLKATAGGVTPASLEAGVRYEYLGDPVFTSEIMPKDETADVSDETVALYGDFSLSSSFGDRRGIMIEVLRERYAEKLQLGILGHERFQVVNHDLGSTTVKGPVAALYGD